MSIPHPVAKTNGDYDFFTPVVNFIEGSAVVAVGGIAVGTVTYLALKALGFNNIAATAAVAISVLIGVAGAVGTIIGIGLVLYAVSKQHASTRLTAL